MCKICRSYPCVSRCPNAPEPPLFAECEGCSEVIYDGDEYYAVGDYKFCEACVSYRTAEVD